MIKDFKNIDNKIKYQILKKLFKLLLSKLFLLLFILNQNAFSKPLPPGSGAGDTPANILLLLDTSESMENKGFGGEALGNVGGTILLDDGDVLVGQDDDDGIAKFSYTSELYDTDFAGGEKRFLGLKKDTTCSLGTASYQDSRLRDVGEMHVSKKVSGQGTNEIIYAVGTNTRNVVAIDKDGNCIDVISQTELGFVKGLRGGKYDRVSFASMDIVTKDDTDIIVVTGYFSHCSKEVTKGRKKRRRKACGGYDYTAFWYTQNLTNQSNSKLCEANKPDDVRDRIWHGDSLQIDAANNYVYWIDDSIIYRHTLDYDSTTKLYCPSTDGNLLKSYVPGDNGNVFATPTRIQFDPDVDTYTIMYLTSSDHKLQKLTIADTKITVSKEVGGILSKDETPATAANEALSADINLYSPSALHVSSNRVWTAGNKKSLQEFDISDQSIQWVDEMGSSKISRAKGAQIAIKKIVTDSSLLQGARFGYGWWNSGVIAAKKGKASYRYVGQTEATCNKNCPWPGKKKWERCDNHCNYYQGWKGEYPVGNSKLCNYDSCLKVAIGSDNSENIIDAVDNMKLKFGTDAQAFAQLALEYYQEFESHLVDRTSPCLLNYVIVIGDGKWRHHDQMIPQIKKLRESYGVITLFVAYGGGIDSSGMEKFDLAAVAGSCNKAGDVDCKPTIVADNPSALLTKLKSEIERIIASRLSFSAPQITANIDGDGDLYQAQFEYVQHRQWTGHLVRKKVGEQKNIVHDLDEAQNWDAAITVQAQAAGNNRKIWTALPGADYIDADWNNFTTTNATKIDKLFRLLGNTVPDYHNGSSTCKDEDGVATGNTDDIKGLIKFIRGYDYFAYEGCSNITKVRSSVLGDIYHSQLIEVGKPEANTFFTANNQEAYWRSMNGYRSFALNNENRARVIYVGGNDGMLHAFSATEDGKGKELWAFVPPFIAARLPEIVNTSLDKLPGERGGTNAIFGVDGSPVIHDMYIRGLKPDGTWEASGSKSWHTILFVTYGRGGNGFSVLDVTDPEKPLHMFSVYNDTTRGKVLVAKHDGEILNGDEAVTEMTYKSGSYHVNDSLEARHAVRNYRKAYNTDYAADSSGDTTTARDNIATCQSNSDASSGTFYIDGTASCYKGTTFTFKFEIPESITNDISKLNIETEDVTLSVADLTQDRAYAVITFTNQQVYNSSGSSETDLETSYTFRIRLPSEGTDDESYDYSKLGETWANPRIARIPVSEDYREDIYAAVLPGGYGKSEGVGSAVFLVNLSDMYTSPGALVGGGPIEIVDVDTSETDSSGTVTTMPDIHNSILGDPIVITPDTFRGATWRGALVYVNDIEGKITKINLTSDTKEASSEDSGTVELYDTTTLFYLNTNVKNGRLSYFGMDAAYGSETKNLWLFGSTGDFSNIGRKSKGIDNILYGIRDRNFPNFVHLGGSDLTELTLESLKNEVKNVDEESDCAYTHEAGYVCDSQSKDAWVFKLDKPYDKASDVDPTGDGVKNKYRKASASPTVYKGIVYYPVYEPPHGAAACGVGDAYICSADDECGTNTSKNITYAQKSVHSESEFRPDSGCYYLQPGILSRLVIHGDTLFANITTSSKAQEDTLISLLSEAGEIEVYRGSWRENY